MDTNVVDSVVRNALSHPRFQLRSMQRDEIEPTDAEKYEILKGLLEKDPAIFLERYGPYLGGKSLLEFKNINNNYEVEWYVNNLLQKLDPAIKKEQEQVRRNRRYTYLAQLLKTDYFSDENMRLREPSLYHHYIGQYKDEEFSEDLPLSEKLLRNMDYSESVDKRVQQRMNEDSESDSDEMEEDGPDPESMNTDDFPEDYEEIKRRVLRAREKSQRVMNNMKAKYNPEAGKTAQTEPASESEVEDPSRDQIVSEIVDPAPNNNKPRVKKEYANEQDQEDKEREFLDIMTERFVNGEDREYFNYGEVDNNPLYDDVDQMQRDYEERYFDED